MTLRLTLVAHAATAATRGAVFPADEPLEPLGLTRTKAMAGTLGRVDAAWTGPALRARQTATALGLKATVDPALADIDLGTWAGRVLADVEVADPVALGLWSVDPHSAPHGGETIGQLIARVGDWMERTASHKGRVVAVTHSAVIRAAVLVALSAPPSAFWRIDVEPLGRATYQRCGRQWTFRGLAQIVTTTLCAETS